MLARFTFTQEPKTTRPSAKVSAASAPNRFGHDIRRMALNAATQPPFQPTLTVSTPGDTYEQAADSVADRVMRTPEPQKAGSCTCGGECPTCSKVLGGPGRLQAKHVEPVDAAATGVPPSVEEATRSSGEALHPATRQFMEPRFGFDFSQVRIHTDASAQQAARDVRARAFTVGRDIVFAAGQYAPHTDGGRRLLAHELAHVAQQSAGQPAALIQREEEESQEGDGDGPNPVIPAAPPPASPAEDTAPAEGAVPMGGGGSSTAEVTLETGNVGAGALNNIVHQQICVDGYSSGGSKRCFSFAADGVQAPGFSSTWLGWSSVVVGALLHGEVYAPRPVPGASIAGRHSATAAQASNWLRYMTGTRLGLQDGYSVARHNCRLFSQWEFRDAPSHF